MKLEVNKDACICCGACAATCPDVFEILDEGYASVKVDTVPKDQEEDAMDAKDGCPTDAIVEKEEEN